MNNLIAFADKSNNMSVKKKGKKISNYLVVAYEFDTGYSSRIYNLVSGKFALDIQFANIDDAEAVAKFLGEQFGEYFPIWDIYPDANVFSLAKWSVKDGLILVEALKRLQNKEVTKEDFRNMLESIDDNDLRLYLGRFS